MKENTTTHLGYKAAQEIDELCAERIEGAVYYYLNGVYREAAEASRAGAEEAAREAKAGTERIAAMVAQVLATEDYDLAADMLQDAEKEQDEVSLAASAAKLRAEEAEDEHDTAKALWDRYKRLTTGEPATGSNNWLGAIEETSNEAWGWANRARREEEATETLVHLLREMAERA